MATATGAPWRDLPERYGPWQTVYERFARWEADGTWAKLLKHVQVRDDAVAGWSGPSPSTPRSTLPTSAPGPRPVPGLADYQGPPRRRRPGPPAIHRAHARQRQRRHRLRPGPRQHPHPARRYGPTSHDTGAGVGRLRPSQAVPCDRDKVRLARRSLPGWNRPGSSDPVAPRTRRVIICQTGSSRHSRRHCTKAVPAPVLVLRSPKCPTDQPSGGRCARCHAASKSSGPISMATYCGSRRSNGTLNSQSSTLVLTAPPS